MTAAASALAAEVAARGPWFHNLHLPDGTQTAPDHHFGDFPAWKWAEIAPHLPDDLSGWTALDIGCNAGFYSFELARRGARVTAIDVNEHYLGQARWAARAFGLEDRVRFENRQVYDLARTDESYDLVLFLGVFYHLRYPLLGLDLVAERVRRLLVFQTLTMPEAAVHAGASEDFDFQRRAVMTEPGWPRMAFIETSFCRDPTNWWAPNHAAVLGMLRSARLRPVGRPADETWLCVPDPEREWEPWQRAELLAASGRPWRGEPG